MTDDHELRTTGFAVAVRRRGEIAVVTAVGELDLASSGRFGVLVEELARRHRELVLDFGELRFMDSSGLHVLLGLRAAAAQDGVVVRLARPTGEVRRILAVTGLLEQFPIVPDPPF